MDPLKSIEDVHGQMDMGRLAVRVFRGALEEAGGDYALASAAVTAYFAGIARAGRDDDEASEEEPS